MPVICAHSRPNPRTAQSRWGDLNSPKRARYPPRTRPMDRNCTEGVPETTGPTHSAGTGRQGGAAWSFGWISARGIWACCGTSIRMWYKYSAVPPLPSAAPNAHIPCFYGALNDRSTYTYVLLASVVISQLGPAIICDIPVQYTRNTSTTPHFPPFPSFAQEQLKKIIFRVPP